MDKKIAIIGAGVGGLATAARLAKDGWEVEVFEKLPNCGGRNNIIEDRGFKIDMGPSFVMMPDFFEEVFTYCGKNISDYLNLKALDTNYRIYYPDGEILNVYKDNELTKGELERIEKGSVEAYGKFIKEAEKIYKAVRPLLFKCFTAKSLVNPAYWPLIGKIHAFESYWHLAQKYFKSEKLCYAFTFEAMFMGVSPFNAPAFYSIISYTDHVQKIFHSMGGMYRIPLALERLAKEFGAKFNYNYEIKEIKKNGSKFILRSSNKEVQADKVVVNADYAYTQSDLLSRRLPKFKYSCSVYLMYLGLKQKVNGLAHHNLFFSKDLKRNLNQIFNQKAMPDDPSFYIHVPTVTDASLAPEGKDLFYILVPVPNLENAQEDIKDYEDKLRKIIFDKINKTLGINLEDLVEFEHKFYPEDFIGRYNIKFGATFGLAHNLMQSAFFRPANFDSKIKDLYFVGASTQPGGGLPVVIAGSRIVADLINNKNI
ncbi:MAG: phytoene desaturase family protein [Candidatus Omnitrophica bacterium]|nr:phytoene desaturase family protein [Candidatus Omnitrophota bacterium]